MTKTVWIITRTGLDRPLITESEMEAWGEYNYWAAKGFTVTMETGTLSLVVTNQDHSDLALARLRERLARA